MRVNAQVMLLPVLVSACFHGSSTPRPARHITYSEALAELHPADAVAAAHTPSETQFAEALENLLSGDIEKAEEQFARLRTSASDSLIRAGSRVVYTATLQYQEKWQTLAALKGETTQPVADLHDLASIELWADAFKNVPAKVATFRSSTGRLNMSISAVGTPLVPVRIQDKVYNFWLDTGSSLTMLASDVAGELGISPLVKDTLEIVTSTGRVKALPALITQLIIGPLAVNNVPAMIVNAARMARRRVGGLGGEVSLRAPALPDLKVLVRRFPILFRGAFVRAPVYQVLASLDGVLGGDVWNSGIVRIDMTNGVFAIRRARNYE